MNEKYIDLNKVSISIAVYERWMGMIEHFKDSLVEEYPDLMSDEIPDEMFMLFNGNGYIYLKVRETVIKMPVPPGEYKINYKQNE